MTLKRLMAVGMTLALLLALAAPVAAKSGKLVVDDDGLDCAHAGYSTIQAAIDDASAGDTIEVCAGTYFGATVDKAVHLKAKGRPGSVVIDDGPNSHSFLRAGFLFNPDGSGSGATVEGFRFVGAQQTSYVDDGALDFAVFSRGADDVTVEKNTMEEFLQGITSWNGGGWTISKNTITDLWTLNGGGIGILVGANDGGAYGGAVVEKNTVAGTLMVMPGDGGGYDGSGIVLFADFRYGPGATALTGNAIEKNRVDLVSDTPAVVNVNGIELTEAGNAVPLGVVFGNTIAKNKVGDIGGQGILVTGAPGNTFEKNKIGTSGGFDIFDDTAGSGTGGTANTYTKNKCDTSSPADLC